MGLISTGKVLCAEVFQHLSEVIDDEPIAIGEKLVTDWGNLPPWVVGMYAIEKCGVNIFVWERFKEMRVLEHVGNGLLSIPHEDHRSLSRKLLDTARKGSVGHEVLHNVNQSLINPLVLAGELVEANAVPVAHETNLPRGVVDEKLRRSDLRTRNQHPMRRKLRIDVRLACALRSQLEKVVVA